MSNPCRTLASLLLSIAFVSSLPRLAEAATGASQRLLVTVDAADGRYSIAIPSASEPALRAGSAVKISGNWVRATDYPQHLVSKRASAGELGAAEDWTVLYTGRKDAPDLVVTVRAYSDRPFGELQVRVRNTTGKRIQVEAIRVLDGDAASLNLGGPSAEERVLSDSFSEDRPAMQIRELANSNQGMHRAVGSQLVYNLQSHRSWFIGALTSDKFLSVLRLHMATDSPEKIASYEVDSTGTTELLNENSLKHAPSEDHVSLSLPLEPAAELNSERMIFSLNDSPIDQLETYGRLIRDRHHARVSATVAMGWWSWTAYYFGLNEGIALTNAQWLSQNLKAYGYTFFHIDEGYQFARGEYGTPDADLFPHGLASLERNVTSLGLTPGIWTAPFEVSERSWIYTHHPEWLVKNSKGDPIHIGYVSNRKDQIFALDTTDPGAQDYLRNTYSKLTKMWSLQYIKLDFMEDSAVEGFYHRRNTTALEAQRIGLQTIRDAVGDAVLLDKDGCEMLNPVGIVDMGRISQDTGHTFSSSKDAATGIAARFFMNRNYFVADPDAFSASTQTIDDHTWHGGSKPLSVDEAKVSMMLSAVSGGLFEIGDDLPTLGRSSDRLALLKNRDLLDMVRLGRASRPIDLVTYESEDLQPSIFLLKESDRQTILTIFNWTETARTHHVSLATLGLKTGSSYDVSDMLDTNALSRSIDQTLDVTQPAHSVRVFKIIDHAVPAHPPVAKIVEVATGKTGESLDFVAEAASEDNPVLHYRWNFGDGVSVEGRQVKHVYTHSGKYEISLSITGIGEISGQSHSSIAVTGTISTHFHPETQRRLEPSAQ